MSLEITSTVLDDHLRIDLFGIYDFLELMRLIERVEKMAKESNRDLVLIDARSMDGHMTESEKFFAGAKIAEVYGSRTKIAGIMKAGEVTKLGEMAAVNRGAKLLMTESEKEAIEWLFKPAGKTVP